MGQADGHQQRGDPGHRAPGDPRWAPRRIPRASAREKSPGTKTFALTGHVANTGLIEVPFGATLRQIVFDIGGGVIDDHGRIDRRLFQGRADRRPVGRMPDRGASRPADGFRFAPGRGGHGRLRRPGGHEPAHVHGERGPLLHAVHPERIVRQVRALPRRDPADAGPPGRHHRGPGRRPHAGTAGAIGQGGAARARSADWARRPPTRCFRHCGISAPRSRPTYFRSAARPGAARPWSRPTIDATLCKGCTVCAKKCPVGAIEGRAQAAPSDRWPKSASSAARAPPPASSTRIGSVRRRPRPELRRLVPACHTARN